MNAELLYGRMIYFIETYEFRHEIEKEIEEFHMPEFYNFIKLQKSVEEKKYE